MSCVVQVLRFHVSRSRTEAVFYAVGSASDDSIADIEGLSRWTDVLLDDAFGTAVRGVVQVAAVKSRGIYAHAVTTLHNTAVLNGSEVTSDITTYRAFQLQYR